MIMNKRYIWVRNRREMIRSFFAQYKMALGCDYCPESYYACLEFHHSKDNKKEREIASMIATGYSIERILKEVQNCELLCANCHRKLTYGVVV